MRTRWTITYNFTPETMIGKMSEAVKEGLRSALLWWHTKRLPVHFTRAAYDLYGYQPRVPPRRRGGGTGPQKLPLVDTGALRKEVTSRSYISATGTRQSGFRATIRMSTPLSTRGRDYVNMRPHGWAHTLRDEVLMLRHDEVEKMAAILQAGVVDYYRRLQDQRTEAREDVIE
jgi:hypothetical protein